MLIANNNRMHCKGGLQLLSRDDGSSILEFGIAVTLLLLIIFGIMDFSRALYAYHYVSNAARDATRYAMVRGSSWNSAACSSSIASNCTAVAADVTNYVKSVTPMGFSANNLVVSTTWPGKTPTGTSCTSTNKINSPGCLVDVRVSYAFNFVLPFLPDDTFVLASTSKVVIVQ